VTVRTDRATLTLDFPGELPEQKLTSNGRRSLLSIQTMTGRQVIGATLAMERVEKKRWNVLLADWEKREAIQAFKDAGNGPPYAILWVVRYPTRLARDWDNIVLALKPAQDMMVERGIFSHDKSDVIAEGGVRVITGQGVPGTTLYVRSMPQFQLTMEGFNDGS